MSPTWCRGSRMLCAAVLILYKTAFAQSPPTLMYNCAKMPSICRNVNSRNPLQIVPGIAGANNLGELDPGQTPGGLDYIVLHYDTDTSRKNDRRDDACPESWYTTHNCPEGDQPPVVASGSSWSQGGYAGVRWNPGNALAIGSAGYNVIANNANTAPSGMFWSCDEWPPATTEEGGAGASTYCAPMNTKCSSAMRAMGIAGVNSEQDIQGTIHNTLRARLTAGNFPQTAPGVYEFWFQTYWDDDATVPAAVVLSSDAAGQTNQVSTAFRRSLDEEFMNIDVVFNNGSLATYIRPFTETEMDVHSEYTKRQAGTDFNNHTDNSVNATNGTSPVMQHFESLSNPPPLPIIDITRSFIQHLAQVPVHSYLDQIQTLLPGLPKSNLNISSPIPRSRRRSSLDSEPMLYDSAHPKRVFGRQNDGECGPGNPCSDGSCCNNNGGCGYGPENCGAGNCTSNCDATAECGRDSAGGNVTCPLDVCCSYYGYCGTDADFCSSPNPDAPCQEGFGSCSIVPAPSCGGSSAYGRSIAYYQVANTYTRECQRITPAQINTTGLTHLNLAFASINPSTFEVVPSDSRDVPIYQEFTSLKSDSLETWIAIGGWDFNDPGPTQDTWSQLAASSSNRATFISSLQSFMSQYGFQGVDIDWEYPGAPDRDGNPADTGNFVELLKEMRAAFGTSYGISATLPASYWYLRWFNPIAMEPYVDFFGLMTYDLHGPWDAQVKDIGPVIIGQTNVPEIYNWTLPLWYDQVDPSKINMGLAYYGRGYTVANVDCMEVGCQWSGTSRPGPCTAFGGVMSLEEIEQLIPEIGVAPVLDSQAMMKYLVWSNQWMGYDDLETISMKKEWASSHCFGGTMIWSIDLYSGSGSGNTPDGNFTGGDPAAGNGQDGSSGSNGESIVYIDPSIWSEPNPVINCEPPCTFILPPLVLPTPTTITFPPYVTSLDVAWSTSTGWTHIIQNTTLFIPPVTTTAIDAWEFTVTDTDTATTVIKTFYPTSSILPPPFTITDDPNPLSEPGVTHPPVTRTITPPPYPYSFEMPTTTPETSTTASSTTVAAGIFPIVTYKPGPPGPICESGCGTPCLIFCEFPCLLDCPDGGDDFPDPIDPNPPPRPTPTEPVEPLPTGTPVTLPSDPEGDEPEDPDEEDDDDECAYEFQLPAPTYVDPNPPEGTQSVSPAAPTPTPAPPPNPAPPSPNPATEKLHCFDSGAMTGRASLIDAITDFCTRYAGTVLDASDANAQHTITHDYYNGGVCVGSLGCTGVNHLSVTVTNGCRFTIDGPDTDQQCGSIFRKPVDQCNTDSTKYKQGGTITSNCAIWDIDPNLNTNTGGGDGGASTSCGAPFC